MNLRLTYVYICAGDSGLPVKVGYSAYPEFRVAEIKCRYKRRDKLRIIYTRGFLSKRRAVAVEAHVKRALRECAVLGTEWFGVSAARLRRQIGSSARAVSRIVAQRGRPVIVNIYELVNGAVL